MHFETSYAKVLLEEGGYTNDANDTGGETYRGVSRNNFPDWQGWLIIDSYRQQSNFPANALADAHLLKLVKAWYKQNFWDVFNLDGITSTAVAYEIFEQSVNHGVGRGARHIQEVCNALNYQSRFGADLAVDGKNGPATRARLYAVAQADSKTATALANGLNCLQGAFYISLGNSQSSKSDYRKYTKGWLANRAAAYTGA